MPQLDLAVFFNQVFILLVVFFIYFLVVSKAIIPSISQIQNTRSHYLQIMQSISSGQGVSEKNLKVLSETQTCSLASKFSNL